MGYNQRLCNSKETRLKTRQMMTIAKDICVYCLDAATNTRVTSRYEVGICDKHKNISDQEIFEILGEVKPKLKGKSVLLRP